MIQYVVGYAICPDGAWDGSRAVLMIRKNRPAWQAGKLNGIGGKVEMGEDPLGAMRREFREECGITEPLDWQVFASMTNSEDPDLGTSEGYHISFFVAPISIDLIRTAQSITDEQVEIVPLRAIMREDTVAVNNTRFMLPMAIEFLECQPQARLFRQIIQHRKIQVRQN